MKKVLVLTLIAVALIFLSGCKSQDMIDMHDIVDIQENDGWYTISLSDGNYYEWSKGEVR